MTQPEDGPVIDNEGDTTAVEPDNDLDEQHPEHDSKNPALEDDAE